MRSNTLLRNARKAAGLTQAELARHLGTTQSAVARLEASGANPRIDTLARALRACGRELALEARAHKSSIDETLVAAQLRWPPGQRLLSFEHSYAGVREIALAGRRARGELA
jgi:transcriptional regulator with XRE-family HTH domain